MILAAEKGFFLQIFLLLPPPYLCSFTTLPPRCSTLLPVHFCPAYIAYKYPQRIFLAAAPGQHTPRLPAVLHRLNQNVREAPYIVVYVHICLCNAAATQFISARGCRQKHEKGLI